MADKRYYWLKLSEDFFDDDTIQYIEEQKNGIAYSNFYLKLCLKSLQSGGKLIRLVGNTLIPYDAQSLAKLTRMDVDTVMVAMDFFKKIGLVEVLENGEIYLSQINEMIGSETDKAKSMRRLRAEKNSKKLLNSNNVTLNGNNVTQALPNCYTDIDIEKDKEIDKEIERKNTNYQEIISLYNEICISFPRAKALSEARKKAIKARLNIYTVEDFKTLFEKAEASDFLKGSNNKNWSANFDWLIADRNMAKTLDGNYDNKTSLSVYDDDPTSIY